MKEPSEAEKAAILRSWNKLGADHGVAGWQRKLGGIERWVLWGPAGNGYIWILTHGKTERVLCMSEQEFATPEEAGQDFDAVLAQLLGHNNRQWFKLTAAILAGVLIALVVVALL